ncbi:MAG TPA: GAF domain-containing protein, partial [Verrucomicrobiae bacterium]|nr:GAF domain-containing protein [Verrucomicrobiae bacterium]
MAIFPRKPRRSPGRPATPQGPTEPPPRPLSMGEMLREQLREIAAAAVAPEDALEPALRAILGASRAQAGALCLFDQRHGILRLVAEVGFSEEGCRRLRNVRRTDPTAWDMPLNGLMNRRAYLIESASRNRYVPRLVEHAAAVRTIACLPLHAGPTPVGSLVLVALTPRSFAERDVRTLERPLGELAAMIEAVRRRGAHGEPVETPKAPVVTPPPPPPPPSLHPQPGAVTELQAEREQLRGEVAARAAERAVLAAELAARSGETDRLHAALELAAADRARLAADFEQAKREAERTQTLSAALAAAERERARLAAALETAAAERAERAR